MTKSPNDKDINAKVSYFRRKESFFRFTEPRIFGDVQKKLEQVSKTWTIAGLMRTLVLSCLSSLVVVKHHGP
jgi:hypothetical protein